MDYGKVLGVLARGLKAIPTIISAGGDVLGTTQKMAKVAEDAKAGKMVSDAELDELEASIRTDLDEFNSPLPPA